MIDLRKCKHKLSKKEILLGIPIEMEHTKSKKKARKIAMQHVCEFEHYYSRGLIPMEKRLKKLSRKL